MTNTKFTSVFFTINLHLFDTVPASSAGVYQSNGHIVNATHNTPETSGNDLTPQQRIFYSKALLENARPNLVHNQFGEQHTVPAGNGKVIQFNGQNPYPAATTPLEEGITPAPNLIDYRKITAELNQYDVFKLCELNEIKVKLQRIPVLNPTLKAKKGKKALNKSEELTSNWIKARIQEIDIKIIKLQEKLTKFNEEAEFDDSEAPLALAA